MQRVEVEEFLLPLDSDQNADFFCVICLGVLVKPMCCREGHSYCDACIQLSLHIKSECPVDRCRLTKKMLTYNRPLENVRNTFLLCFLSLFDDDIF